jgi:DNA-binding transcriptional LysR family regulator
MFVSNNESIKQLLIAGIGISIIPLQSIELELKMGKLTILDVEDFEFAITNAPTEFVHAPRAPKGVA